MGLAAWDSYQPKASIIDNRGINLNSVQTAAFNTDTHYKRKEMRGNSERLELPTSIQRGESPLAVINGVTTNYLEVRGALLKQ